jgi:hypothetical protein
MRIDFTITGTSVPDARIAENIVHARSLGLPLVADRAGGRALNVIGRGPSVARHAEYLRSGDADNWACGTAWAWCRDNGIAATLICVDAHPRMADSITGTQQAIAASQCDPAVFAALGAADVALADEDKSNLGSTAAVVAAVLGATRSSVTRLYGCEGSYAETTHANENIPQRNLMVVRANGRDFATNPQMLIQSEELAALFRMCRGAFEDYSGGLLGALIATGGGWDLVRWDNAPANVRDLLESEHRASRVAAQ